MHTSVVSEFLNDHAYVKISAFLNDFSQKSPYFLMTMYTVEINVFLNAYLDYRDQCISQWLHVM